jgi:hypothetical protein
MKDVFKIVFFIVVLILAFVLISCADTQHRRELTAWAQSRGETVREIERCAFRTGPYWYVKGSSYYTVTTDKGLYWVKYSFGRSIQKELPDGKYLEIE